MCHSAMIIHTIKCIIKKENNVRSANYDVVTTEYTKTIKFDFYL